MQASRGGKDDRHEHIESLIRQFREEDDIGAPTSYKPGSPEKVALLAARYYRGIRLWVDDDKIDHSDISGSVFETTETPGFELDGFELDDID